MDKNKVKKSKKDSVNEIGIGYIPEACRTVGVSNTVYYTAKKKLETNKQLTKSEIAVMAKYKELTEKAKADLETIRK